jgi:hypothetical protein
VSGPGPHPLGDLAELVAGVLPPDRARVVGAHVAACPVCRAEAADWSAVAESVRRAAIAPSPELHGHIRIALASERATRPDAAARLRWLLALVVGQVRVVRREIWPASAVLMAIGALAAVALLGHGSAGTVFALFAPLAAGLGIALVYGPGNDPALELALATPASPRLVLLARLTLVVGWDLALAMAATLALAVLGAGGGMLALIGLWLGPMLVLGSLCLVLSVAVGTAPAIAVAMALWAARTLEVSRPTDTLLGPLGPVLDAVWQTNVLAVVVALATLATSLWLLPRLRVGPPVDLI